MVLMQTTPRIASLAALATVAAALPLPAAATARPIYDNDATVAQHVSPQAARWQADDQPRRATAAPAPAAAVPGGDSSPLPPAGGVTAIVILPLGPAAVAVKRREPVRPAVPTS